MTARVLRPVITLTTVMAILVASIAVYALMTTGTTHADSSYHPTTRAKFCNDLPSPFGPDSALNGGAGACTESTGLVSAENPDITTTLDMVSGDLNFTNVVTLFPRSPIQTLNTNPPSGTLAVGQKVGGLHSETYLGTLNTQCDVLFPVDFLFFNAALPDLLDGDGPGGLPAGRVDNSSNISWPQPEGTSVRFGRWGAPGAGPIAAGGGAPLVTVAGKPLIADGTNNPIVGYPHHLVRAFDKGTTIVDGDATDSLLPLTVYGGLSKVAGTEWVPLYFVTFPEGLLTTLATPPLNLITAEMGTPSVSVLNDPTAEVASPSTITDFCTPLNVTTMLLGKGLPSATARVTNGTTGASGQTAYLLQYNASYRDLDQDSYENALDTCPLNRNAGSPRVLLGGDPENDGIDSICQPSLTPTPVPPITPAPFDDVDGDSFKNRQDNCPLVANGIPDSPTPPAPTFTPNADSQADSELGAAGAADKGPRTDQIGDACESGETITTIQNCGPQMPTDISPAPTFPVATNTPGPCPTSAWVSIGPLSDTTGNGRYMTVTNVVTKCIEPLANAAFTHDVDHDGYCTTNDNDTASETGQCATQSPASCTTRHDAWSGATHPALQMDSDGDKQSDALETYVTTDPTKSCAQTSGNNNEPMDNWMFDLTDNLIVDGGDKGPFGGLGGASGFNAVQGPFGVAILRPGVRFDFNTDGLINNGGDVGKFGGAGPYTGGLGPFGRNCTTNGVPAFSQQ